MMFLVDARLPRRLGMRLDEAGFDTIHTLDLVLGNRTPDAAINEISLTEQRIIITKDADFVESFILQKKPWKPLLISTGNIRNAELETLFLANLGKIKEAFSSFDFVELNRTNLIIHS